MLNSLIPANAARCGVHLRLDPGVHAGRAGRHEPRPDDADLQHDERAVRPALRGCRSQQRQPRARWLRLRRAGRAAASTIPGGTPRLYWDQNSVSADRDKTYSNGVELREERRCSAARSPRTYDLTDNLALKSITGYRQIRWRVGIDLDGTPEQLQEVTDAQHQQQFSQEFQLNGKALNDRLNYVGGLYYFEESGYVHDYVPFEGILNVYDFAERRGHEVGRCVPAHRLQADRPLHARRLARATRATRRSSKAARAT